jgi:hypothetical protein
MHKSQFSICKEFYFIFYLFFFLSYFSFSQADKKDSTDSSKDSLLYHKVMLIPYDPLFYLSDAERDIIEQTHKEARLIRETFRRTIDVKIKDAVEKRLPCISLLFDADSIPSLKDALSLIYARTGYQYDQPMPIPFQPEKTDSSLKKIKKNPADKESYDSKIASKYITVKGIDRYMNAVISKPSLLNDLYNQFGTDVFIFVNQFEIKTNYKSCLDIANEIYKRELMVHFSVYDKNGKQLAGAYAMTFFPSDSNNAYDIMKNCFPDIGRFVANCIP